MRTCLLRAHVLGCLALAGLAGIVFAPDAWAVPGAREVGSGNRFFKAGQYEKAAESYEKASGKNPSEPAIDYDLGTAYYKTGDFDKAAESFQKSLLTDDERLRRNARYNLGNALYRSGIASEEADINKAISHLEKSVGNFEQVIAEDTEDQDSRANQELVKKELERLKQKQQEMKQQGKNGSSRDNKDQANSQPGANGQKPDSSQKDGARDSSAKSSGDKDRRSSHKDSPAKKNEVAGNKDEPDGKTGSDQPPAGEGAKKDQPKEGQGQDADGNREGGQQKSATAGQSGNGKVLSQEEARAILDDFDQNEQPKGLLNFIRQKREERPVEKDW